jgi:hypothetical protein
VFTKAGDVRKKHGTHSTEISRVLTYYFAIAHRDAMSGRLLIGSLARSHSHAAKSFRVFAQLKIVPHE